MEFLAIVAFLVVVLAVYVISNADRNRSHSQLQSSSETVDAYAEEDKRFDDAILKKMGSNLAGHFYTKIVGITFKNKDGVTREKLIPTASRSNLSILSRSPRIRTILMPSLSTRRAALS